jgi:hypothetical protein
MKILFPVSFIGRRYSVFLPFPSKNVSFSFHFANFISVSIFLFYFRFFESHKFSASLSSILARSRPPSSLYIDLTRLRYPCHVQIWLTGRPYKNGWHMWRRSWLYVKPHRHDATGWAAKWTNQGDQSAGVDSFRLRLLDIDMSWPLHQTRPLVRFGMLNLVLSPYGTGLLEGLNTQHL